MRVYVPFGKEWFPYFMRRLGERPANVGFVLRSLVAENRLWARWASGFRRRASREQRGADHICSFR